MEVWTILDTKGGSAGYLPVEHRRYSLPFTGELELAGSSWLASAAQTRRHVAVARNARRVAEPAPEPGEFVEVVFMGVDRFRAHLRGGNLTDVDLGYLALDHLGLLA